MRYLSLVLIFCMGLCTSAFAANHYVRPSTGTNSVAFNGDGTTWAAAASNGAAGAFKGFPASTAYVRGDTYYYTGGTWGSLTINTNTSGTTLITIQHATVADHGGMATGWVDTYGTTTASFDTIVPNKGYLVIDGGTGGGPGSWKSGFISVVDCTYMASTHSLVAPAFDIGGVTHATTPNVTIRHFEVIGDGGDGNPQPVSGGKSNDAVSSWGSSNTVVEYCYLHDMGRCIFLFLSSSAVTIQYNYTDKYEYDSGEHSEIASTNGSGYTFQYNIFAHCEGTGGLMFNNPTGTQIIRGNVFFHSTSDTSWAYDGNGMIGSKDSGEPVSNVLIYNNTFYRVYSDSTGGGPQIYGFYMGTDSIAKNNLYYGALPSGAAFAQITHDYNEYRSMTGVAAPTETNRTVTSGSIFTDAENLDFRLTSNTTAGTNLGSPYDVDMLGSTRATWTRGATEFVTGSDTTAPTPNPATISGTPSHSDVTISVTATTATDETSLGSFPYRFSKDNGSTWTAYQLSASYTFTGLTASTAYQVKVQVKDAAGNLTAASSATTVTTDATTGGGGGPPSPYSARGLNGKTSRGNNRGHR